MPSEYREEIVEVLKEMMHGVPDVKIGKAFGYPALKVGRRIFAFVGGDGLGIKLGAARVQELIESDPAIFRVMEVGEGILWKDWLSVEYEDAEEYFQTMPLLQEAQQLLQAP